MQEKGETSSFLRYIWLVPTATAAVLVFGAVETGGFALFPVYGNRIGYSEADAALLLTMIGLGNVILQIPLGIISDRIRDRRDPAGRLRRQSGSSACSSCPCWRTTGT